jgi:hypothetical protein
MGVFYFLNKKLNRACVAHATFVRITTHNDDGDGN